ncbi:MAG: TadE family protein [Alphaproteobacteria bacterium]
MIFTIFGKTGRRHASFRSAGNSRRTDSPGTARAGAITWGRRLRRDRRGSIAIEFALIAPIMLTLAAGTMQFGWLIHVQNSMFDATRNVARSVSVGTIAVADAEDALIEELDNFSYGFDVDASESADDVTVSITLPSSAAVLVDFGAMFEDWTLAASVTMPKET